MSLSGAVTYPASTSAVDEAALLAEIIETQNDLAAVELDPQIVMRVIAQRAQKLTRADGAVVDLINEDHLVCHSGCGLMEPHDGNKIPLSGSLAGHAIRTNSTQYCEDAAHDPRVDAMACRKMGVRSLVAVPLFNGTQPIGAVVVLARQPFAFGPGVISALRLIAGLIVSSLTHAAEFEIKKKLLIERTDALAALRQSEKRFHSAFEHAAIGMALVGLDGRWLQVNPALCRIVGYTRAELLVRDFQSITFPADLETDLAYVRQLVAGQIPEYQMVKRYIHRQGHLVWVMLSVSLVRSESGAPIHFIAQIQDITQRQQTEEALRASEEEYRATFELDGVGKIQADLTTRRFLRVNHKFCQITGYSLDELRCLTFSQITHPDDQQSSRDFADRMLSGGLCEFSSEKRYIRKDGQVVWVSLTASILKDAADRPTRAVATVVDITERKRAEWLEQDRRTILEMVARHLPLPDVLARLAEAVERQLEGCTAAVMVLHDGKIETHAPHLPEPFRDELGAKALAMSARLSESAWGSDDSCGVTDIAAHPVWSPLRATALAAGLASCWTLAIQSADGAALGVLTTFSRRASRPSRAELQTLQMAGQLATICIEHHQAAMQLSHLVRHDPLTGLPNRLLFDDRVQQALALARRTGKGVALLALDIDKFKTINDTLGHHAGDHLLQQFAHRVRSQLRETDTIARIGGDEFLIVLPNCDTAEAATIVARKIITSMADPFTLGDREIHATTSLGVARFPDDADDAVTLQKTADAALYRAKEQGRNRYAF